MKEKENIVYDAVAIATALSFGDFGPRAALIGRRGSALLRTWSVLLYFVLNVFSKCFFNISSHTYNKSAWCEPRF